MIEAWRSVHDLVINRNPYDSRTNGWADLGGELGENVTLGQIQRVVRTQIRLDKERDIFMFRFDGEDAQKEAQRCRKEAEDLKKAKKLQTPEDYDALIAFFSRLRDHNEGVLTGRISEGSRFGRSVEEVKRRYVQSRSAVDFLLDLRSLTQWKAA